MSPPQDGVVERYHSIHKMCQPPFAAPDSVDATITPQPSKHLSVNPPPSYRCAPGLSAHLHAGVPGVLGHLAKGAWFAGAAGIELHYILALAAFVLSIWRFVEIACLRGNTGPNKYGSNPLSLRADRG